MTEPSKRPPASHPSRARSGEHPAVKAYRAKLESLDEGATKAISRLDSELQEFLSDLKSIPPPPTSSKP